MRSTPGSVQSIDRVLEILETLSTAPLGMSLSDLSAATGLHISTTHRLVNVLTEHGYALKDSSSGKYRLTLRTFEIGSRVSSVWNLLSAAKPHLDELAATSQEAVHLVERDGKRCGFSKRYFLVLVACRHLTCTKTECRKMFLSLIAPLTTIRLNRGKRSNRLPYIFAQGQER